MCRAAAGFSGTQQLRNTIIIKKSGSPEMGALSVFNEETPLTVNLTSYIILQKLGGN